jgi:hypothetical protein
MTQEPTMAEVFFALVLMRLQHSAAAPETAEDLFPLNAVPVHPFVRRHRVLTAVVTARRSSYRASSIWYTE